MKTDQNDIDKKFAPAVNRALNNVWRTPCVLPKITSFDGSATDGVAVNSYGKGQLSSVLYTVPAHGVIEVDFTLNILCITPDDVATLSALIRSLLDASKQHVYDDLSKTDICGGAGFFGFFSFGVSASYSDTKHRMDSWGLSEANQQTIVKAMTQIAAKMSTFNYKGTIYNRDYDYSVTGNMYAIVMDVTASFNGVQTQNRVLAPTPSLVGSGGETIPSVDPLYPKP